jgi:hypothetical protein
MPSSSKSVCTGARDEPVDDSAVHVVAQFAAFERTCSQLKDWKPVGKKGPILDVADVKVVTELLLHGRNRRDIGLEVIPELGCLIYLQSGRYLQGVSRFTSTWTKCLG